MLTQLLTRLLHPHFAAKYFAQGPYVEVVVERLQREREVRAERERAQQDREDSAVRAREEHRASRLGDRRDA